MKRKEYESKLRELQIELRALRAWVRPEGQRVIVVFEGRDGAGKGGVVKAITERVSPRVYRVVGLPAPSDRERPGFTCSGASSTFRPRAESQFSTGVGATVREWNM